VGKETKFITKLFTHTKIKIGFKTSNSISKTLRNKNPLHHNKYFHSSVYQISCPACNAKLEETF